MGHALTRYLSDNARRPYKPGEWDCVVFASGWVKLATGRDYLERLKPYQSLEQGYAQAKDLGYSSLSEALEAELTPVPQGWVASRIGDIAVVDDPVAGECLGIVGSDVVHVLTPRSIGHVPKTAIKKVYRP